MRILYHHRTQGRGAEGNHIVSIVTALRALGHQVDVLSPPGVDPFDPASTIPVDKAKTQTRGWGSLWKLMSRKLPNWLFEFAELFYNVPAYFRLRRALSRGKYDLLFERYAFYLVAGAVAAKHAGVPFLLEVNEVNGIPNRARKQSFVKLCGDAERFIFRRCTVVHAVSSWLGEQAVVAGLDRSRLVVVPNGFEIARLKLGRSRDDMRRQLGLDGGIVIGFAGWFDHWDRLDLLVDLFEELRREHPVRGRGAACHPPQPCPHVHDEERRERHVRLSHARPPWSVRSESPPRRSRRPRAGWPRRDRRLAQHRRDPCLQRP